MKDIRVLDLEHVVFEAIKSIRSTGEDYVTMNAIFKVINRDEVKKLTNKSYTINELKKTINRMVKDDLIEELIVNKKNKPITIIIFTIKGNYTLEWLRMGSKQLSETIKSEDIVYN